MTDDEIQVMLMDVINHLDYDIYKSFLPELAEDPEGSKRIMEELISVVRDHLND